MAGGQGVARKPHAERRAGLGQLEHRTGEDESEAVP